MNHPPLLIRVFERDKLAYADEIDGPIELGRQSEPTERVYAGRPESGRWRIVIARMDEQAFSRRHLLIEPLPGDKVRLTNTSAVNALHLSEGRTLAPQGAVEVPLPAVVSLERKTIQVLAGESETVALRGLPEATLVPDLGPHAGRLPRLELPGSGEIAPEAMVRWLQTIMGVLQTAASSPDFFRRAAQGAVDIVGLDSGRVLLFDGECWQVEAEERAGAGGKTTHPLPADEPTWRPSRRVLARLRAEKRTFWVELDAATTEACSPRGITAVVAAPILDRRGEAIGALYGERHQGLLWGLPQITKVDAMLLELLATGVATGLARLEQERATLAARVQFEQFFTPELARELETRPDLLRGQEREVTLLFSDIRGFSRISERIGPKPTLDWIGDVMGTLSDCVLAHRGVLVDYIGDELIAMWGAPQEEPEHTRLACRAALAMLRALPELNARWESALGEPMGLGIGINTGAAQVGNTGSRRKFKYGVLGNTVNLASRVEGATKYLKTNLLVTGSTREKLDAGFATRRLCTACLVNIAEPVPLFELAPPGQNGWASLRQGYEEALAAFERREFHQAARALANLLAEHPDDGPALILLSRTVNCLIAEPAPFDPVWYLTGK